MINVLFVCMGNICRSPTAHGMFQSLVEQEGLEQAIRVDSAGTHVYHIGEVPDPYYGGGRGFEPVLDLVEAASQDLLQDFRDRHL